MKKIFSKKFLIILVGILLFVVAAAFLVSFYITKNKPIETYFIGTENIPSITTIVGERKQDKSKPKEEEEEDSKDKESEEDAEAGKEEDKEDKEDTPKLYAKKPKVVTKNTEDDPADPAEADAPAVPAETPAEDIKTEEYTYINAENGAEDVGKYVTFLMDQYNYISLQDFDSNIEEGSATLAGDSAMKRKYMQIDIAYKKDTYTITLQQRPGSIEDVIREKQEEEERKRKEEEEAAKKKEEASFLSRDQAAEKLNAMDPKTLGLEKPFNDYSVIYGYGRNIINDKECYSMNAYINKNSAMYIAGVFYVACDGSQVYRYDVMNDSYIPINAPDGNETKR